MNPHDFVINHYNWTKGWDADHPDWYKATADIPTDLSDIEYRTKASDLLNWLYNNIENSERHARWILGRDGFHVKFRYEKDCLFFILRWS